MLISELKLSVHIVFSVCKKMMVYIDLYTFPNIRFEVSLIIKLLGFIGENPRFIVMAIPPRYVKILHLANVYNNL